MLESSLKFLLKPFIVVFIGVILTAIAEILREKSEKAKYILVMGIVICGMGGILSAIESDKFEKNVQGNLIGGNSYCFVESHFDEHGVVNFSLKHEGEYPLYDLTVLIRDRSKFAELVKALGIHNKNFTNDEWTQLQKKRDLIGEFIDVQKKAVIYQHTWPSLPPAAIVMPILRVNLPHNKDEQQYLVKIYARNGTITQPIKFLKVDGKWEMSTRIQKYNNLENKLIELSNRLHPKVPLEETYAGE